MVISSWFFGENILQGKDGTLAGEGWYVNEQMCKPDFLGAAAGALSVEKQGFQLINMALQKTLFASCVRAKKGAPTETIVRRLNPSRTNGV